MRAEAFFNFMIERERVRLRKEAGLPRPWTDDQILRSYKFTNVKRTDDRTTREMRKVYDATRDLPVEQQLLNCAIARYFGTWEFLRSLHDFGLLDNWYPEFIRSRAHLRMRHKERVFTGAYVITNQGIKGSKIDVVIDHFLEPLRRSAWKVCGVARVTRRWESTVRALGALKGFGGTGFMAKEVVLDTMLTSMWPAPPVDLNSWTPVGPGARRGAARLLGDDTAKPLSEASSLGVCRELFSIASLYWPEDYVDLELHDIQFQLCEFDKYERVRLGQGRPRSRYDGG